MTDFIQLTDAITENDIIIRVDAILKIEEEQSIKDSKTCSVRKIVFLDSEIPCEYVKETMKFISNRLCKTSLNS